MKFEMVHKSIYFTTKSRFKLFVQKQISAQDFGEIWQHFEEDSRYYSGSILCVPGSHLAAIFLV